VGKALTELSFEDWLRHIFDHPVNDPPWYFDPDADYSAIDPGRLIGYTRKLFDRGGELLAPYNDAQANQGLWHLVNEGGPLCALGNEDVPLASRVSCIQSMTILFEQYFVPRCTPHLSHLDEAGAGPLNGVCYMWWDIFPLCGQPEVATRREIDSTCLSVMEKTLQLPSIACQESALHGLSHWGLAYESRCESTISAFLREHVDLRPNLRKYAILAAERGVL
jgi:hypothetical protein